MSEARARIRCAESGHMWPDEPWFQVPAAPNAGYKFVWERHQECSRTGCSRIRRDRVMPRTFELVSRLYGGRIERIGQISRAEMREEIIGG